MDGESPRQITCQRGQSRDGHTQMTDGRGAEVKHTLLCRTFSFTEVRVHTGEKTLVPMHYRQWLKPCGVCKWELYMIFEALSSQAGGQLPCGGLNERTLHRFIYLKFGPQLVELFGKD